MAVKVIRGEDIQLALTIFRPNGDPYDLTGATEIEVEFQADSGCIEKLLTLGEVSITNAILGKILT